MNSQEIRKIFLDFYEKKGHSIISGSSLIPENDSTTLFIGSGMQPLVPYLLGQKHPAGKCLTNSQKSFRTEDIEEVGDGRHTTFFEMLGNWSLGDYFKKEQLTWVFELLTEEFKIDPNRLYITVFRGNDEIGIDRDVESVKIWKEILSQKGLNTNDIDFSEKFGMKNGRIFYYDENKNWWSRSGPPKNMAIGEIGGPDSEIFYDLGENLGHHEKSQWKNEQCHVNCDCGRFIEIGNNVFIEYIKKEKGFCSLPQKNVDFGGGLERIVMVIQKKNNVFETDLFFGIMNKIKDLTGLKENGRNSEIIADHIKGAVFLIENGVLPSNTERGYVLRRLIRRAVRFGKLINMPRNFLLPLAKEVFKIYPEIKKSNILEVIKREEEKFEKTLEEGIKKLNLQIKKAKERQIKEFSGETAFNLYQTYGFPFEITKEIVEEEGMEIDKKKFQKKFQKHQEISRIGANQKFKGGLADSSDQTTKYHTATHLLLASLRSVLGNHVYQKGSNITSDRLRFDFHHRDKMTEEEIKKTEELVNQKIKEGLKVEPIEMNLSEARKEGAVGVFNDKYGDKVIVYKISDEKTGKVFSKEMCGGPHVKNTKLLGKFKINKEESSSSNTRRIKANLNYE